MHFLKYMENKEHKWPPENQKESGGALHCWRKNGAIRLQSDPYVITADSVLTSKTSILQLNIQLCLFHMLYETKLHAVLVPSCLLPAPGGNAHIWAGEEGDSMPAGLHNSKPPVSGRHCNLRMCFEDGLVEYQIRQFVWVMMGCSFQMWG